MMQIKPSNVGFWLQADVKPPEIEVRFAPNTGHSARSVLGPGVSLPQ